VSILKVALLDTLQSLVKLGNNWTCLTVLANVVVLVVIKVVDVAQWCAHCSSSALGCLINLGKLLPLVGGILGGGMDAITTQTIASNAYRLFIEGQMPTGDVAEEVEEAVEEVEAEQVVVEEVACGAEDEGTEADALE
jgi:hypothetical protein